MKGHQHLYADAQLLKLGVRVTWLILTQPRPSSQGTLAKFRQAEANQPRGCFPAQLFPRMKQRAGVLEEYEHWHLMMIRVGRAHLNCWENRVMRRYLNRPREGSIPVACHTALAARLTSVRSSRLLNCLSYEGHRACGSMTGDAPRASGGC